MKNTLKTTVCFLFLFSLVVLGAVSNAHAKEQCSSESFSAFFSRFREDAAFSQERTIWPLEVTTEQVGENGARTTKKIRTGSEFWGMEKTVAEFLKDNPRIRTYVEKQKSGVIVTFAIEDGDVLFDYKFKRLQGCWTLVDVRDFER